ncbi:unnamed protein product [Mucor hiemalis]
MFYNNKIKAASACGLCIGVVFGTAASYFGKKTSKSYVNIMSKYITGSAVSIVALLSVQGLIKAPESKQRTPLQHLKVLNYQYYSISSTPSATLPMNIHSRYL